MTIPDDYLQQQANQFSITVGDDADDPSAEPDTPEAFGTLSIARVSIVYFRRDCGGGA